MPIIIIFTFSGSEVEDLFKAFLMDFLTGWASLSIT